jgi:predicted RNA-binding Zn ribbon-like protein
MFTADLAGLDEETRPISLEFANTVRWHASQHPEETLLSFTDLVAWARQVGLTTEAEARRLTRHAQANSEAAQRTLDRAVRLREAIYAVFTAIIHNKPVPMTELDQLNAVLNEWAEGARIEQGPSGFTWRFKPQQEDLDTFLGPIALSAANLLLTEKHRRVGQCADDRGCGWLFLDTSKNHSRRWCDMNDCGNRAKQKRLKQRKRVRD